MRDINLKELVICHVLAEAAQPACSSSVSLACHQLRPLLLRQIPSTVWYVQVLGVGVDDERGCCIHVCRMYEPGR